MSYVEGRMTVLANATDGILNMPLPIGGSRGVSLGKGEWVDIEQSMSKEAIRHWLSELERIESLGYIRWFSKGTRPTHNEVVPRPGWVPSRVGTSVAPPNEFDRKLNAMLEEERRRDERTLPGDLGRVTEESYSKLTDAAEDRARVQREAELAAKEAELAEREKRLAEREARASKRERKPVAPAPVSPSVDPPGTVGASGDGNLGDNGPPGIDAGQQ